MQYAIRSQKTWFEPQLYHTRVIQLGQTKHLSLLIQPKGVLSIYRKKLNTVWSSREKLNKQTLASTTRQFLKARHCSVISVDNTTLPETFRARKWYTLHFPLHERFHGCLCFRVEQYLMWLWSWCVLGLTDQIRSLCQATPHVTVETAVDPNLPL